MNIPFSKPPLNDKIISNVQNVLKSGWLTTGSITAEFEKKFAEYIGAKYAIALNSGTAALHLSLLASNINKGDIIISTSMTFVSTIETIIHTGLVPRLIDIEYDTQNIDPEKIIEYIENNCELRGKNLIEKKSERRVAGIIPVHIAGHPCNIGKIQSIAKKYHLFIINDAAHCLNTDYKNKRIGSRGHLSCFSFYPTKNITTGEGGMITMNCSKKLRRIRLYSLHGLSKDAWKRYAGGNWRYDVPILGYKYNISDINSAIGLSQFSSIEKFNKRRSEIASYYNKELSNINEIEIPVIKKYATSISRHLYIIKIKDNKKISRDKFINKLAKKGIGTSVHFIPVHKLSAFMNNPEFKNMIPYPLKITEQVFKRIVSIPLYPALKDEEIEYIVKNIKDIFS